MIKYLGYRLQPDNEKYPVLVYYAIPVYNKDKAHPTSYGFQALQANPSKEFFDKYLFELDYDTDVDIISDELQSYEKDGKKYYFHKLVIT